MNKDKYVGISKVGEKGQIVIPKEARDMFDIKPGDSVHYWKRWRYYNNNKMRNYYCTKGWKKIEKRRKRNCNWNKKFNKKI